MGAPTFLTRPSRRGKRVRKDHDVVQRAAVELAACTSSTTSFAQSSDPLICSSATTVRAPATRGKQAEEGGGRQGSLRDVALGAASQACFPTTHFIILINPATPSSYAMAAPIEAAIAKMTAALSDIDLTDDKRIVEVTKLWPEVKDSFTSLAKVVDELKERNKVLREENEKPRVASVALTEAQMSTITERVKQSLLQCHIDEAVRQVEHEFRILLGERAIAAYVEMEKFLYDMLAEMQDGGPLSLERFKDIFEPLMVSIKTICKWAKTLAQLGRCTEEPPRF